MEQVRLTLGHQSTSRNSLCNEVHCESESVSRSVVSESLRPPLTVAHQAALWISLSKNTGVGCHALLQEIPTQGSNLVSHIAGRFFTI